MTEPKWIDIAVVKAVHAQQIRDHGGVHGIRDEKLLHSALDAPKNSYHYDKASLSVLAAKYAHAIAGNHPFVDGNKRTAYICMRLFLKLNGQDFTATGKEKIELMLGIAGAHYSVEEIAAWLEEHMSA